MNRISGTYGPSCRRLLRRGHMGQLVDHSYERKLKNEATWEILPDRVATSPRLVEFTTVASLDGEDEAKGGEGEVLVEVGPVLGLAP